MPAVISGISSHWGRQEAITNVGRMEILWCRRGRGQPWRYAKRANGEGGRLVAVAATAASDLASTDVRRVWGQGGPSSYTGENGVVEAYVSRRPLLSPKLHISP